MTTAADFRRTALALEGVVEGEHQSHPDFRVHGRVFATLTADGLRGMVKVSLALQQELVDSDPAFSPANGAWGRQGCTMVELARVSRGRLEEVVIAAWTTAAALGRRAR